MQSIKMRAYNLRAGACFMLHEPSLERADEVTRSRGMQSQKLVVTKVLYRHTDSELICVLVRRLDGAESISFATEIPPMYLTEQFDFNDSVWLLGLVVNEDGWDDADYGTLDSDLVAQ